MKSATKIAGIGFREGATLASILDALARTGATVNTLALPARKQGHPLCAALQAQGFTLHFIPDEALAATETPTQSTIARHHYATGSVAEAAALAAARVHDPNARLAGPRVISADRMATAALALTGDFA